MSLNFAVLMGCGVFDMVWPYLLLVCSEPAHIESTYYWVHVFITLDSSLGADSWCWAERQVECWGPSFFLVLFLNSALPVAHWWTSKSGMTRPIPTNTQTQKEDIFAEVERKRWWTKEEFESEWGKGREGGPKKKKVQVKKKIYQVLTHSEHSFWTRWYHTRENSTLHVVEKVSTSRIGPTPDKG